MSPSQPQQPSTTAQLPEPPDSPSHRLTRTAYLVAPLAVITAALLLHARNNPVPAATLSLLVTAAYGHTLWQEVLLARPRLFATWSRRALHEHAETIHTVTRNVRDTHLAIQPTTR